MPKTLFIALLQGKLGEDEAEKGEEVEAAEAQGEEGGQAQDQKPDGHRVLHANEASEWQTPHQSQPEGGETLRAPFHAKDFLNFRERNAFWRIRSVVEDQPRGFHLFAQANLGEFVGHPGDYHGCINCKRVDFCIVDDRWRPVLVIEYDGDGHKGETEEAGKEAETRDLTKEIALEEAGIPLIRLKPADLWNFSSAKQRIGAILAGYDPTKRQNEPESPRVLRQLPSNPKRDSDLPEAEAPGGVRSEHERRMYKLLNSAKKMDKPGNT